MTYIAPLFSIFSLYAFYWLLDKLAHTWAWWSFPTAILAMGVGLVANIIIWSID